MRLFLLISLLTAVSALTFGQSITLLDPILEESIATGNTVETELQVKNSSDHIIRLGLKLNDSYHKDDQLSSICIGDECFSQFSALEVTTLNPGEILRDVRIHFNAGYDELTRELTVTLYDIANPSETLTERFRYHIKNDFPNGILFANEALQISKVYPNPVASTASIDYDLQDGSQLATISVHNILGDQVLKLQLDQAETNLKISTDEFPNGIYFYTLQLNGQSVTTKKFVVRK
ncbi:T9SS type A sorting domain-containing protein [Tunicatimonas pelagia]|uniref:T9SS type A sorting domain-containing protein n=1 Tax=Tunicatimonas pelagia TaxID=931531 RepID=UPI00266634B4|nr:T9SS type A sorting domain-containing protein [Tunicatimonas pelagia]WKN42297.1 T9SS type A sorting domain-containing protein [Tunicatimonas pelagia]